MPLRHFGAHRRTETEQHIGKRLMETHPSALSLKILKVRVADQPRLAKLCSKFIQNMSSGLRSVTFAALYLPEFLDGDNLRLGPQACHKKTRLTFAPPSRAASIPGKHILPQARSSRRLATTIMPSSKAPSHGHSARISHPALEELEAEEATNKVKKECEALLRRAHNRRYQQRLKISRILVYEPYYSYMPF